MAWGDTSRFERGVSPSDRAPAFNIRGQVRGFRSRPGAPQADQTQSRGAINSTSQNLAGTSNANWAAMFRNKLTGTNPLAGGRTATPGSAAVGTPAAITPPTTGLPHVDTALSTITGQSWGSNNDFKPDAASPDGLTPPPSAPTKPLDLTTMVNPTHAQAWGAPQLSANDKASGWQTGDALSILKKYQTPGTTASVDYGLGGGA